jgi:diguanylate cyclase (GGDEF)-like protein
MDIKQLKAMVLLVAAGVLYNLILASSRREGGAESFLGLTTVIDLAGIALMIAFTGGPASIFVFFLAIYIFAVSVRVGVGAGLFAAAAACAGLAYFYLNDPTAANQTIALTRGLLCLAAPIGAFIIDHRPHAVEAAPVIQAEVLPATVASPAPEVVTPPAPVPVASPAPAAAAPPVAAPPAADPIAAAPPAQPLPVETPVARPSQPEPAQEIQIPKVSPEPEKTEYVAPPPSEPIVTALGDVLKPPLAAEIEAAGGVLSSITGEHDAAALKEKMTELAILHEASKALGATLVLEEVIDTIVDISAKGLMADIAGALIYDEKTGLLTVAGLRGFTAEEREVLNSMTFTPGETVLGEVFSKRKTINVANLSDERPGTTPFNGRIKAFVATPLATDGYDIGVLFLGKYIQEPFSISGAEFLETMAAQAAIAVENARLYSQAQELAIHDGLTGIYNYRYLMKQLEEELKRAERYGRSVSLAMIDIDLFKQVNDSHGHQRGDEVLKGLVQMLVSNTRDTDIVARYGGEEFVVILPETDVDDALEAAEKLRSAVAKASFAREKGSSIKITISLGIATYPAQATNQEDLLRLADDALYTAKTKRNMVVSAGTKKSSPT